MGEEEVFGEIDDESYFEIAICDLKFQFRAMEKKYDNPFKIVFRPYTNL